MNDLTPIVAEHPIFADLATAQHKVVAACASNASFHAGEYLFREGEPAERFFVVRHGQVAIEIFAGQRGPLVVQTVVPDDVIGWSWLVPPHKWRFDARATELTRVLAFDAGCLRGKMESDHELGFRLLRRFATIMAARLEGTRMQLLDLYGAPA